MGDAGDISDGVGGLRGTAADVGPAVRIGGGHHVLDRFQARSDSALGAVGTGHQGGKLDVIKAFQLDRQLLGIGECGHLGR